MRPALASIALLILSATAAEAASIAAPPHPPMRAVRTTNPMRCDGVLDETAWTTAPPVTDFYQSTPDQGARATLRSEFRIVYDDDALYVGARLFDPAPDSIQAPLGRRDASLPADRLTVYIDPYHDKRSGYLFVVNAAGLKVDGLMYNDGAQDLTWDGVWEGRPHRDSLGWSAELRIPFSQMRFQADSAPVWGINFKRVIYRRGEESLLAYTPRDGAGFVSRFPDLVGIDGIRPARAIELAPYVTSKGEYLRHAENDPFNTEPWSARTGLDLRAPVGRRLTLNATINPDFGQVEVDPAIVNLSDVESTFEEKRPYFVEGASNFRFGQEGANSYWNFNWNGPQFFYSRRIGRAPQGRWPSGQFHDVPIATNILGAAKLTGKITPTTNFGTLQALTGKAEAKAYADGVTSEAPVEPLTYYEVTRGLKEFAGGRSGLGVLSTAVLRRFDDAALRGQLNHTSVVGGLDGWHFLDSKKLWVVSGWAAASHVTGEAGRLTAVQRSSRHYFQRPDADHVEVDSAATSMLGVAGRLWLNKQSGRVMSNSAVGFIAPDFEVNDLGVQSRSDVINAHSMLGYQWTADGRIKRHANLWTALQANWNFDGDRTHGGFSVGSNVTYRNNWFSWQNAGVIPPYTDTRGTRGGPRMKTTTLAYVEAGLNTDSFKKRFYSAWSYFERDDAGGFANNGGITLDWKPKSNLLVSVGPWINNNRIDAQYVTTVPDAAASATYGQRFVFGELDQNTVGADLRLNWTFTPELSLETYVQPFFSSGRYEGFKSLARPDAYEFEPFALGSNQDFDVRSLRGNAVARWEYRPGSTLFLVWTQQRDASEFGTDVGEQGLGRGARRVFDAQADNVFLAKVSYHLGL